MSASCCHHHDHPPARDDGFRRVLWIALAVNAGMFLVEGISGLMGASVSLQADALDFLGDAANYGLGLAVLGLTLTHRATAALIKGVSMGLFGLWVVGAALYNIVVQSVPSPAVMGVVGFLALAANLGVALMLYRHRRATATAARSGCAPATTPSATWRSCWPPPASSPAAPPGPTWRSPSSWPRSPCRPPTA